MKKLIQELKSEIFADIAEEIGLDIEKEAMAHEDRLKANHDLEVPDIADDLINWLRRRGWEVEVHSSKSFTMTRGRI